MLLDDIASYLQTQGLGTLAVDLFLGTSPPDPDATIVIREYGGGQPVFLATGGEPAYEYPRFQLTCRGVDYVSARDRAERCYRALSRIANQQVGTSWYLRVVPLQSPFPVGQDESDRELMVANFEAIKALSP